MPPVDRKMAFPRTLLLAIAVLGTGLQGAAADPVLSPTPPAASPENPGGRGAKKPDPPICLILPLSGPHKVLGTMVLERFQAAREAASVRDWEARDDEGTEEGVARAAAWARERACGVWVGGIGDRESRAMAREAEVQDVPLVGLWSGPQVPDGPRLIRAAPDRRAPVEVLCRFLKEAPANRVFLLVGPSAGDRERGAAFQQACSGIGAVKRVDATPDPRTSARALAEGMADRQDGGKCQAEVVVLVGEPDLAVRWKGFLEAEGELQGRDRCPGPLVAGPPSWATPEAVRRFGLALEGAVTAAWRDKDGVAEADPLAPGIRLAVEAVSFWLQHRGNRPAGDAVWEGVEVTLEGRTLRYRDGHWEGADPVPLRIESGRIRWLDQEAGDGAVSP